MPHYWANNQSVCDAIIEAMTDDRKVFVDLYHEVFDYKTMLDFYYGKISLSKVDFEPIASWWDEYVQTNVKGYIIQNLCYDYDGDDHCYILSQMLENIQDGEYSDVEESKEYREYEEKLIQKNKLAELRAKLRAKIDSPSSK